MPLSFSKSNTAPKAIVPQPVEPKAAKGLKESDKTLANLKKQFGEGFCQKGGKFPPVTRVKSGIFPLDYATGGGFPRGKVVTVYGTESSGKSALLYKMIRAIQQRGETAALVDLENSLDEVWAKKLGINLNDLIVIRPDTGEQAVDAIESLLYASDIGIVGVDSIAALIPHAVIEGDGARVQVGGNALLVTKMLNKAGAALSKASKSDRAPILFLVNQIRMKIGVMFGDPETMPGGNALKFTNSLTIRLYGKPVIQKDVDQHAPSVLHVGGIIKKYKVPIAARTFEYDMATVPNNGMRVGDCDAWPTVLKFIKQMALAEKTKKGYLCCGEEFKTLDGIEQNYRDSITFRDVLEQAIFDTAEKIRQEEIPLVDDEDE